MVYSTEPAAVFSLTGYGYGYVLASDGLRENQREEIVGTRPGVAGQQVAIGKRIIDLHQPFALILLFFGIHVCYP